MHVMWAPWRGAYISGTKTPGCIFCNARDCPDARADFRLAVQPAIVMLNRFPYASVHLMVAPRTHTADLAHLERSEYDTLMRVVQRTAAILEQTFKPDGMNIGINLGAAAGAGVADHLHWHLVPRWHGDTNFMPMLADVRVMPEHLEATWEKLHPLFGNLSGDV
jgi:ATP adenylyltransferase